MKYRINPATITSKSILKCIVLMCTLLLGWLCREVWQKESWQLDTKMLLDIHHWASPVLDRVMLRGCLKSQSYASRLSIMRIIAI
jgi:hypothetical protein